VRATHGPAGCAHCKLDFIYKQLAGQYGYKGAKWWDFDIYKCYEYCGNCSETHWEELSQEKSGAKFILTTRPIDSWVVSFSKHLRKVYFLAEPWSRLAYDYLLGTVNRGFWKNHLALERFYNDYVADVQDHFKGTSRLLVLNVWTMSADELWEKLAEFLGVNNSIPSGTQFPSKSGLTIRYHFENVFRSNQDGIETAS
jgi:hypothetical protein